MHNEVQLTHLSYNELLIMEIRILNLYIQQKMQEKLQEITILLKTLHELEFIVAYHKHLLASQSSPTRPSSSSSSQCLASNLKEFYRIYLNIKKLTCILRNGIWRLYTDKCQLSETNANLLKSQKPAHRMHGKRHSPAKTASLSMTNLCPPGGDSYLDDTLDVEFGVRSSPGHYHHHRETDKQSSQTQGQYSGVYNAKQINPSDKRMSCANKSKCLDAKRRQKCAKNKSSFHSSASLSNTSSSSSSSASMSPSLLGLSKSTSSLALVHSSPITTTIAQAIEETEALMGLDKQTPFNYLHNKLNTTCSKQQEHTTPGSESVSPSSNTDWQGKTDCNTLTSIGKSENESLNFFNFNSYVSRKAVKSSPYFFNLDNEMTQHQQCPDQPNKMCTFVTNDTYCSQSCNVVNRRKLDDSEHTFFFKKVA